MIRLLTFTSLFPSGEFPRHGIFVKERLRQLLASGEVDARVCVPVPWFPFAADRFGQYGRYARIARTEQHLGLGVRYPRYLTLPKISMSVNPLLIATAVYPYLRAIDPDWLGTAIIDAHYLYPDGVAAVILGGWLGRPVVMTARGQDVTLLPSYRLPRAWLRWACRRAAGVVTVSESLRTGLLALGAPAARLACLRNGVDLDRFQPVDRERARRELGMHGQVLLAVGNLIELKGHHLIIDALPELPDAELHLIGEGPERAALAARAVRLGVADRCHLHGNMRQEDLVCFYSAADMLLLPSSREGLPNVVLESLACGTPVIATAVGGVPELLGSPDAGLLLPARSAEAIVAAVRQLASRPPPSAAVRRHAGQFGWSATVSGLLRLFGGIRENENVGEPNNDRAR